MKYKTKLAVLTAIILVLVLISNTTNAALVPFSTQRVSLLANGNQNNSGGTANINSSAQISQDGRYVAFSSDSSQFVVPDTGSQFDVFVRDRISGSVVRANVSNSGTQMISNHLGFEMSKNGRYVVFAATSAESNLVIGDTNGKSDLFVRDLVNNTTERVSISSSGVQQNGNLLTLFPSNSFDISADGRYVVFSSSATNLVASDTNGTEDVFVRDRKLGTTTLLSKSVSGILSNGTSRSPSISCDGSYVAFSSAASNLVSGDANGLPDFFVSERISGDLKNITLGSDGWNSGTTDISCNGSSVVYRTMSSNLVANDTNASVDIFAYNMESGITQRVSLDSFGNEIADPSSPSSQMWDLTSGSVDFSGRYVVFASHSPGLVSGDTNAQVDVFIRDLEEGTTQIVSNRSATTQSTAQSYNPSITLDGREIIFTSSDTGLVAGDTNGRLDAFVSKTGL